MAHIISYFFEDRLEPRYVVYEYCGIDNGYESRLVTDDKEEAFQMVEKLNAKEVHLNLPT